MSEEKLFVMPPAGHHECPRCHRVFAFENTLDDHWLRVHVGE